MASDNSLRLAVLIDADNASPTLAEPLLAEVAKYGTAHVKRAYGDWTSTNLTGWKAHLPTLSIQPVQQFAYASGRNATDSALIIDAMDLLYTGRFDGFCQVSSDSDFTRLAGRLRESGLTVFGIGERKTPRAFVAACDKFVYAENLSSTQQSAADTALDRATQIPGPDLIGLVTAAVEASSDENGWAHLGAVGNYLSKSRPHFDTRTYGHPKLKPLVQSLGAFHIDQGRPGEGKPVAAFVRCRDRARSDTTPPEKTLSRDSAPPHQVTVIDAAGERVRLQIPLEHPYRDTLLRGIYTAWRDGEIDTIGALEAVIERNAPEMEKPTRTIAIKQPDLRRQPRVSCAGPSRVPTQQPMHPILRRTTRGPMGQPQPHRLARLPHLPSPSRLGPCRPPTRCLVRRPRNRAHPPCQSMDSGPPAHDPDHRPARSTRRRYGPTGACTRH